MHSLDSSGGRLSPLNIKDPLLRAELFREIRLAQTDSRYRSDQWGWYEIQPADVKSADLVAYKVWGMDTLKWVVLAAAALDNPRELLTAATRIYLPSAVWLRQAIQRYMAMEKQ